MARQSCIYRFGEFRLDGGSRVLLRANEPVRLPLKAIEILLTLVERCGDVVTKEEIMAAVWPDRVVDDANLKQNIAVIRRSLAIERGMPGYIETFVGRGYRIIGASSDVKAEPQPQSSAANADPAPQARISRFSWPVRIAALIFVCAVSALAFEMWRYRAVPAPSTVSRVTPVTRLPGVESQPAVAPDGKRIAFLWQQRGGKPPAIWVKSLDREDPVRVGSREGRHASPAWSPDGQTIAYLWIGTDHIEIMLAQADGSQERVLTRFPHSSYVFRQRLLDWSPDGRWLCLSHAEDPKRNSTLFVIDSATGTSRRLTQTEQIPGNDMSPRFSPDGAMISYIRHIGRTEQELRLVPFRGGPPRSLISEARRITGQDWDRQGKSIVFASDRTGEFRLWRVPVGVSSPAPGALDIFSEYPMDISIARHAPVLVYSFEAEDRNIWRLDLKEKRWDRLIASSAQDASPQYSPDGSHICFRSNRSGEDQLWVADGNGEHPVQVTKGALNPNFGHWSPDGHSIVFNDRGSGLNIAEWRDGKWVIRRLGMTGSHPVFSKDGKWLYAGRASGIVRVPNEGGAATTLSTARAFSLAVSPREDAIYFSGQDGTTVWRILAQGGEVTQVLDGLLPGCTSCWALAPDGIYYLRANMSLDEQALYFKNLSTGQETEILPYPEPLVPLGSGPFSLSPDGRYLLCVRTELPGGDLMMIEPFL